MNEAQSLKAVAGIARRTALAVEAGRLTPQDMRMRMLAMAFRLGDVAAKHYPPGMGALAGLGLRIDAQGIHPGAPTVAITTTSAEALYRVAAEAWATAEELSRGERDAIPAV